MRDKLHVANIEIHKWNEYDSSDNGCTRARKSKGASCVESKGTSAGKGDISEDYRVQEEGRCVRGERGVS